MTTTALLCTGLDGADPVTLMASLGLFTLGQREGLLPRMTWRWSAGWRAEFEARIDRDTLVRTVVDALGAQPLAQHHPVCTMAKHLGDVEKDGLTPEQFRQLATAPDSAPYLPGLACDGLADEGKVKTIARSALSFANGGSGKALIKDFAALLARVDAERVDDALFGRGRCQDKITGLGWDPASQRAHALQFSNPETTVQCQVVHHALAFFGLSFFPVLPTRRGAQTLGVCALANAGIEQGDADHAEPAATAQHSQYYVTWPIWSALLDIDTTRALIGRTEFTAARPDPGTCRALGLQAVLRSRRFTLSKRTYLSPSIAVY